MSTSLSDENFLPPVKTLSTLEKIAEIPEPLRVALEANPNRFAFRANDYYLGLIDWTDPDDPLRRLVIPAMSEGDDWGSLDASNEADVTVVRGLQHKYKRTAVLLCSNSCAAYCRYCFRKRLFNEGNNEVPRDISAGIAYLRSHAEISDVILTGGDPLMLGTGRLSEIVNAVRAIDHVRTIRIGTKIPAFNPWRILEDDNLCTMLKHNSSRNDLIYIMAHFDHPRELTKPAVASISRLIESGARCLNQCPLIRGVNDDPSVLADLFTHAALAGCPQYYLFQCRPTSGNRAYCVPIVQAYHLFIESRRNLPGILLTSRYVVSHETGKIEIIGIDERCIYTRYLRAKDPNLEGQVVIYRRDDNALWIDELSRL